MNKREAKASDKLRAAKPPTDAVLTSSYNSQELEDQQVLELHLRDFTCLADHFVELQRRQKQLAFSEAQRGPLNDHVRELQELLRYLTRLNTHKKRSLVSAEESGLTFFEGSRDLALQTLVSDFWPQFRVKTMKEYRSKFQTLSDFLVPSAGPSETSGKGGVASDTKLGSSRSSPVPKLFKMEPGMSQCQTSTNLNSVNGDDSHDWCEGSPKAGAEIGSKKLLFGAPSSAKAQESKEISFGQDQQSELTQAM